MAFGKVNSSLSFEDISTEITEAKLAHHYLGVTNIPCVINSPLRTDSRPSFGLYSNDGKKVCWKDLATKERGGIYDLLSLMWSCTKKEVLSRIQKDRKLFTGEATIEGYTSCSIQDISSHKGNTDLRVKVRDWRQYDIDWWASYGISLDWLKYADVYPISHKIIIKGGHTYTFGADKLAYVYVERKEGKITLKVYQPLSTDKNHKWFSKHDRSVISLWTKIPEKGERVCICSSLKDALCLWANTNIPAIATQGEGYGMSLTAISELKRRYANVYILFDNDKAGLEDGVKLAKETGFINLVLPQFEGGKDVSDLYKSVGKKQFQAIIFSLFKENTDTSAKKIIVEDIDELDESDLPF